MQIIENKTNSKVSVGSLEPFQFFEWNGKVYLKMRDRNRNITDIWDPVENIPEWLMPGSKVKTIAVSRKVEENWGATKQVHDVPYGEMFHYAGKSYLKAYPFEHGDRKTVYDIKAGDFIQMDEKQLVIQVRSEYTIVRAAE